MSRVNMEALARNRLADAVGQAVDGGGALPVGAGNTDLNKFDKPVVKKPAAKKRGKSRAKKRA